MTAPATTSLSQLWQTPCAAAESDRDVAGFGEVEQARVAVVPRDREAAADEGHGRTAARRSRGNMRRAVGLHEARGVDGDRAEGLRRDALGRDAASDERRADALHEAVGSAQVVVGVLGHLRAIEDREIESSADVVLGAGRLPGVGPAVGHDPVAVAETGEQRVDLGAEGVVVVVARPVHPPDRPRGLLARQGVQHREHGGRADPGAQQHDRARAVAQDEGAPRGGGVEQIADLEVLMQVAARFTLALDADPVAAFAGHVRQRVAAGERRAVAVRLHAHGEVLPGLDARARRRVVGRDEPERGDGRALTTDLRDAQGPEPGPRRCRRDRPSSACAAVGAALSLAARRPRGARCQRAARGVRQVARAGRPRRW